MKALSEESTGRDGPLRCLTGTAMHFSRSAEKEDGEGRVRDNFKMTVGKTLLLKRQFSPSATERGAT